VLSVWRLLVLLAAALPSVAPAAQLSLDGDALGLDVQTSATGGQSPAVGSQANLVARYDGLDATLDMALKAGPQNLGSLAAWQSSALFGASTNSWNSRSVGLNVTWSALPRLKLDLSASDEARSSVFAAPGSGVGEAARSRESQARVDASLDLANDLELELGGEVSGSATESLALDPPAGAAAATTLWNSGQNASATIQWHMSPRLSLTGGGAVDHVAVAWRGGLFEAASNNEVRPQLSGAFTPWAGGKWTVGVERVASPLDTGAFVSFAEAIGRASDVAFRPNQEWRYRAGLEQQLPGDVSLSTSLAYSRLLSVTELGPVGQGQAPVDIGGGERRQIDLTLTAPLRIPGLHEAKLTGSASWRASRVTDPFTGDPRPASGETPYQAELRLDQALPGGQLRWGVKGRLDGGQRLYQMSQVATLSPTAGLGGFVEYRPGDFALRLQADNLIGGGRTDTEVYYAGSRAMNLVDRTIQQRIDSRQVQVSLNKPF
jgi:hypothetical protein